MSDTPRTDLWLEQHICMPNDDEVGAEFARKLERECNQLRAAMQSVMDWNPKPEPTDRPQTVARFEADMAKARKVLEETE